VLFVTAYTVQGPATVRVHSRLNK